MESPGATESLRRPGVIVLVVALALTAASAWKPIVMDEAAYHAYAEQIAGAPLDPYGFEIFWYEAPRPASDVLAPPVLPYWWAAAIALGADHPVLWKLWLLPVAWLLCQALHSLLVRFTPGLETPLLWMIAFSPAVLPSFNLMLDIPVLALGTAAVALFARACDANDGRGAAFAGLVVGLALETKYSGSLALAAIGAYALIFRRLRLGIVAGVAGLGVFAAWELFTLLQYGESHFVHHALRKSLDEAGEGAIAWSIGAVALAGALAPGAALLALAGTGRRRALAVAAALAALPFAVLPWLPVSAATRWHGHPDLSDPHGALWLFGPLGLAVVAALVDALRRNLRAADDPEARRRDLFLAVWLAIAVVGFFVLSPFLATRRAILFVVVAHLVAGRCLWRSRSPGADRSASRLAMGFGIALGLLYAVSDQADARSWLRLVDRADAKLDELAAPPLDATRWYVGHWGFQFEAERRGMRPVVPGETLLRRGDLLVVPDRIHAQRIEVGRNLAGRVARLEEFPRWPWTTLPSAYLSHLPIRGRAESRIGLSIYRVAKSFVAEPRGLPPQPAAR